MFQQLSSMLQMLWIHMNADRVRWGRRNGVQCFVSPLSDLFYPTFLHGPALYKNPQMPDSPASKIYKYSQTSFKWIPRPRRMPRCPYCSYRIAWYQTRSGAATSAWQGWQSPFLLPGGFRCFRNRRHKIYHTVNCLRSFLSPNHSVCTWSLGHLVTQSLDHSVTLSLSHSVTIFNITTNWLTDGRTT